MLQFHTFNINVRNNKVILTGNYYEPPTKLKVTAEKMKRLGSMKIKGEISNAGRRLIENRFNAWYQALAFGNSLAGIQSRHTKKRFVLITLTLPCKQMHSDEDLKRRALKPFIKWFERNEGVINWAWKAEAQNNGNIHFHIVTDTYIPKVKIDAQWRHYMMVLGYLEKFWEKHPGKYPPMTNVTGQSEMKNPVAYVTKYFAKKENKRKVSGAIWRMSRNLLHIENYSVEVTSSDIDEWLQSDMENVKRVYDEDFFMMFILKKPTTLSNIMPQFVESEMKHWERQLTVLQNRDYGKWKVEDKEKSVRVLPADQVIELIELDPDWYQLFIPGFDELDVRRFRDR